MDEALSYMYEILMLDVEIFDMIYEAAKQVDRSSERDQIIAWYKANIDPDDES